MTKHLELAVCDYPEHVPQDRWATYAQQQKELGLSFVRIAEFAWSKLEPREGDYDWAWLDLAVDTLHQAGLGVVLCTPTATPPAWLVRRHPEILAVDKEGRLREFGSRRHYDFASSLYREYSRKITKAMAERYGKHPGVVAWQTDNEFGCHDTARSYGGASAEVFPNWLQKRYGTLERLNLAWGNVFWSMEYSAWKQIKPPNLLVTEANPSHILDFYRFCSEMIAEFQAEQVKILREYSPNRKITHNFMIFESGFDHYAVAKGLDFVSWDNYPTGMLEFFAPAGTSEDVKTHFARVGHPDLISFNHDLYRGMLAGTDHDLAHNLTQNLAHTSSGQKGFWVMEQQCGQVNWAPYNPLPAHGAVQLWTAQAWAHGADVVSYFRWRAATMAQEVMHSGLLRHNESFDRGFLEVKALEPETFPEVFPLGEVPSRVAVLHDYESLWIWDQQKHSAALSYWTQVVTYYSALRILGIDVDIVHPDTDLSTYALIVAPALTLMSQERAQHLELAAQRGSKIVFGPRTAYRTPSGMTPDQGQFGPLSSAIGARLHNFDSLRPGLEQDVRSSGSDILHPVSLWAESYELNKDSSSGATALYHYANGPLAGEIAVLEHGNITVIGAHSATLITEVLSKILLELNLAPTPLPEGVRLSRRAGKTLLVNFNPHAVAWNGLTLEPVSFTFV